MRCFMVPTRIYGVKGSFMGARRKCCFDMFAEGVSYSFECFEGLADKRECVVKGKCR